MKILGDARSYLLGFVFLCLTGAIYGSTTQTIGVTNQDVFQTNISQTICVKNWSSTVRPPTSYTTPIKNALCKAQNCGDTKNYELDHFISIEIGGSPTDPKNLVLQAYPEAHQKDVVENHLHKLICDGSITLMKAQQEIYDWKQVYSQLTSKYGQVGAVDETNNEDD